MELFRTLLALPVLIPATLIWVLGLLLLCVASLIAGKPEWVEAATGRKVK